MNLIFFLRYNRPVVVIVLYINNMASYLLFYLMNWTILHDEK